MTEGPSFTFVEPTAGAAAVSLDEVRRWCEEDERTLRNQYPGRALPEQAERELERCPADTAVGALRRWALIKHLWRVWGEGLERAAKAEAIDAQGAARQLLTREPVRVEIGERVVEVTGRSYAAMHRIAAHALRIRSLAVDLERAGELFGVTEVLLRQRRGIGARRRLRRRLRRLEALYRAIHLELHAQRQALYAHAFTANGAPAASPEEAPAWWEEIDLTADALLLGALLEAGPLRYARLGEPPKPKEGGGKKAEDLGWASLFASIERQAKVEPATYFNRDLWQALTWLRAGASPELEDLEP